VEEKGRKNGVLLYGLEAVKGRKKIPRAFVRTIKKPEEGHGEYGRQN